MAALRAKAEDYWNNAWAESTVKSKAAEWKAWLVFCRAYGFEPLIPTEESFALFATFLSLTMAVSSVEVYIGGVRRMLDLVGCNPPSSKNLAVNRVLMGMAREKGREVDAKEAMTPAMLLQIKKLLSWKADEDWLMWGVLVVGFFSFLRPSNLLPATESSFDPEKALAWDRVVFGNGFVDITYRWSKVIQFRGKCMTIRLVEMRESELCPVAALRECERIRVRRQGKPVFAVVRGGKYRLLTMARASARLQEWSRLLGWGDGKVTLRSLRIGGASWAFRCGVSVENIKIQGDWASDSWFRYLRRVEVEQLGIVSSQMAGGLAEEGLRNGCGFGGIVGESTSN